MKNENEIEVFKPTEFGWVSPKTPPTNHNSVVILIRLNDGMYLERIGFFEDKGWEVYLYEGDDTNYTIEGWFPYPYTPNNH